MTINPDAIARANPDIERAVNEHLGDNPPAKDPIQAALDESGLGALQQGASMGAVEEAVRALASLLVDADDVRRAIVREAALKKLSDIGISAPGKLLDAALECKQGTSSEAKFILFDEPEPWPDRVNGDKLLEEIAATLRCYVVLPNHAAHAIALWILHTWCIEAFDISALLAICSATKRSGKTTLLEIICMLVARALLASNITPAALFRSVESFKPTLSIDEADTFLRDNEELRNVLNAGHRRRSAFVIRTVGDEHEPKQFCTFGAKAIALIGKLPGTLEDRSILIEMRRRAPGEKIERFLNRKVDEVCKPLRQQALRWASDTVATLRGIDPDLPTDLNDRAADNWRPLFAIAEHCGGKWPERAKAAALALSVLSDEAEGSALVELLQELKELFEKKNMDRVASADLVTHLGEQSEKRWAEWSHGKPITARQVAKLLAHLKIKPGTIRIGDETPKGYMREAFEDAFSRYLPLLNRHNDTTQENQEVKTKIDPPQKGSVADQKETVSNGNKRDVADVADQLGMLWETIGRLHQ